MKRLPLAALAAFSLAGGAHGQPTAVRAPVPGHPWSISRLFIPMEWISAGTFSMGSPVSEPGRGNDEVPHQVTLSRGYWLGRTPVTIAQWVMEMGSNPSLDNSETPEAPVDGISWNAAMEFCRKLTGEARAEGSLPEGYCYTLPTEAQWEYARRAGRTGPFTADGSLGEFAWYRENSGGHKHPVGLKRPNAWGLHDMEGNINEWCQDWYGQYSREAVVDPIGPEFGTEHVFRGGAFRDFPAEIRAAYRYGHQAWEFGRGTGMRLALAPAAGYRTAPETVYHLAAPGTPPIAGIPDPLRDDQGQRITSPEAWTRRRSQMREVMAENALGHAPPPPGNVVSEVVRTQAVLNGAAEYRLVRLRFGPDHACQLLVAVYVPQEVHGPVPFWVFLGFRGTPGAPHAAYAEGKNADITPEQFARERIDALRRGYGILTFDYQEAGLDNTPHDENRSSGFFPAYPKYDWGALMAWSWAASRCVDYLQTQSFCNPNQIALTGHSRLGKVTLVAAAYDDRFTLAVPTGSGCGGTGLYRENSKSPQCQNSLDMTAIANSSWWNSNFRKYFGRVDELPFDQNWLVALVAPRPLLSSEGFDDLEATPRASLYTYEATLPVYAWLHAEDRLGMYFRPGGHDNLGTSMEGGGLNDATWQASLDFADHFFKGLPARQNFHNVPEAELLK
jgi:hypothetical protein